MSSDVSFVEFVVDQIDDECAVTFRKMFGEFGLYSHGKFFAVICDNQLFVKPTDAGRRWPWSLDRIIEGPHDPRPRRRRQRGTVTPQN